MGFTVLLAHDGREAIDLARACERKIDVLLTDISMPEIGGPEAARAIQAFRPNTKVIFMSGYATRNSGHALSLPDDAIVIFKPFSERALVEAIDKVLAVEPSRHDEPSRIEYLFGRSCNQVGGEVQCP